MSDEIQKSFDALLQQIYAQRWGYAGCSLYYATTAQNLLGFINICIQTSTSFNEIADYFHEHRSAYPEVQEDEARDITDGFRSVLSESLNFLSGNSSSVGMAQSAGYIPDTQLITAKSLCEFVRAFVNQGIYDRVFLNEFAAEMYVEEVTRLHDRIDETSAHSDTLMEKLHSIELGLSDTQKEFDSKIASAEKTTKDIEDRLRTNTISSITVLSIFTGIVMAFMGGFQLAAGAFSLLHSTAMYRILSLCSFIGWIIFNGLLLFVFLINQTTHSEKRTPGLMVLIVAVEIILFAGALLGILGDLGIITVINTL